MSNSEPPPESGQSTATGDSIPTDQSAKYDFLKNQTVTLTLDINDILEGRTQLNGRAFSVSGQMEFTCKNCREKESSVGRTSQTYSTPEQSSMEDNSSPSLCSAKPTYDSESQEISHQINKGKTTFNEASGLLSKCAERLEELRVKLDDTPGSDNESVIEKNVNSEIQSTACGVIKMLENLIGGTVTVTTNNNDDKNHPLDDTHERPKERLRSEDDASEVLKPVKNKNKFVAEHKKSVNAKASKKNQRTSKKYNIVGQRKPAWQKGGGRGGKGPNAGQLKKRQKKFKIPKRLDEEDIVDEEDDIDEQDEPRISMEVMIPVLIVEMHEIWDKQTNEDKIGLTGLLKKMSLFHRLGDSQDYIYEDMVRKDKLKTIFEDEWKDKNATENEICESLRHFFDCKYGVQVGDVIGYIHNECEKVENREEKVDCRRRLFSQFSKEIYQWIKEKWFKNAEKYVEYWMQELEEKSKDFVWRIDPPSYNENLRVIQRIEICKTYTDTIKDRLISECYKFATLNKEYLQKFHKILDVDLDFICTQLEDFNIKETEYKFFQTVYGFGERILDASSRSRPATSGTEPVPNNPEDVPKNTKPTLDIPKKEVEVTEFAGKDEFSKHHLILFFSEIKNPNPRHIDLMGKCGSHLKKFYEFHKSEDTIKSLDNRPDAVISKMFRDIEDWRNGEFLEHQFCQFLEDLIGGNSAFASCAKEMLIYMQETYKEKRKQDNFSTTFLRDLANKIYIWICSHRPVDLAMYVTYQQKFTENKEGPKEYHWKPTQRSYETLPGLCKRLEYHFNAESLLNKVIASCYHHMRWRATLCKVLDDDFNYIFTRPAEIVEQVEFQFFCTVFCMNERELKEYR